MTRAEFIHAAVQASPVVRYLRRALARAEETAALWAAIVYTWRQAEGSAAERNRAASQRHRVTVRTVQRARFEVRLR